MPVAKVISWYDALNPAARDVEGPKPRVKLQVVALPLITVTLAPLSIELFMMETKVDWWVLGRYLV